MGGFVFFRKGVLESGLDSRNAGARALKMMQARGLDVAAVVKRPGFELHLYRKRRIEHEQLVEFDNGDFIAATGTLMYQGQTGLPALKDLYSACSDGHVSFETLHGHFAVWIACNGRLDLFNDYRGFQQVYHDAEFNLVSTSFLAIHAGTGFCKPNLQELYEYLAYSCYYGRRSLVKGICRLDRQSIHQLHPRRTERPKPVKRRAYDGPGTFDDQLEHVHALLRQYFDQLVGNFGDRISLGLTSGFDSRMTLAYLRLSGCRPNLYVQGPDDATDVKVAKAVAEIAGLPIAHDSSAARPEFRTEEFERQLLDSALYLDGLHHAGLFQDWALVALTRSRLPRPEKLRLYGMVGEIFRRSILLPERKISVGAFLSAWGRKTDISSFRGPFNKAEYLQRICDKIVAEVKPGGRALTPEETQLVYPYFKAPANEGWQMSAQNERAYALCPFAEPSLVEAIRQVRMPYRRYGRFQSALMTRADPVVAAVPSSYGYAFSEPPPLSARWRINVKHAVPAALRPHLYRLQSRRQHSSSLPFYLQHDYLRAIFPDGCPNVAPLLDFQAERNTAVLSRAYTLELLLSGRFLELT